jgi:hypothetical protein
MVDVEVLRKTVKGLVGSDFIDDRIIKQALDECDQFAIETLSESIGFERGKAVTTSGNNVFMADFTRKTDKEVAALDKRYKDLNALATQLAEYLADSCSCRLTR